MADGFRRSGANPQVMTIRQLLLTPMSLCDTDLIGLAGGFSYGDHFGSGRVAALDFCFRFQDQLLEALARKIPMIGICNGFQMLVAMGLLPGGAGLGNPTALLDFNSTGRFEHWHDVTLVLRQPGGCVWTKELDGRQITIPVGHGEGRLVTGQEIRVIATYGNEQGVDDYPISPNGCSVAGICDESGLIMGMMPHPERRIDELHGPPDGLAIFQAGVNAVR